MSVLRLLGSFFIGAGFSQTMELVSPHNWFSTSAGVVWCGFILLWIIWQAIFLHIEGKVHD